MKQIFISEGRNNVKELHFGLGRSSIAEIKEILPVLEKISVSFAIFLPPCHRESHTEITMTVCTHCRFEYVS